MLTGLAGNFYFLAVTIAQVNLILCFNSFFFFPPTIYLSLDMMKHQGISLLVCSS